MVNVALLMGSESSKSTLAAVVYLCAIQVAYIRRRWMMSIDDSFSTYESLRLGRKTAFAENERDAEGWDELAGEAL
jgi:hypothetical protein